MEPSPFRPHTTIAIENVKIAANEAHPKVKIIIKSLLLYYNLFKRIKLRTLRVIKKKQLRIYN